jgi:DNA invertase Pin-like site-specific DNA recombinase
MMKVGYARVSTPDQNLSLQLDALKAAGCEKVFTDIAGGSQAQCQGLQSAVEYLREGDTIVVWRLDRLGRSLRKLIDLINSLHEQGIGFKSLVDAIDTSTPTGQFFFHVTGAFAELERSLIRERTIAGLQAARSRGRNGGRPKAIDQQTFDMALQLYEDKNNSVDAICKKLGIARRTFYRYVEQHRKRTSRSDMPCS